MDIVLPCGTGLNPAYTQRQLGSAPARPASLSRSRAPILRLSSTPFVTWPAKEGYEYQSQARSSSHVNISVNARGSLKSKYWGESRTMLSSSRSTGVLSLLCYDLGWILIKPLTVATRISCYNSNIFDWLGNPANSIEWRADMRSS